jgi:hypothetical protein
MRRWTIRVVVGLCSAFVVAALTGATYQSLATRKDLARTPPPGRLVDIGGYRLHLWCTGEGAPAVILDAGLGGTSAGWGFVQPDVARFTRVCSYDRAGMGYSDSGPSPRTGSRPITRRTPQVSCSWMPRTKTMHMTCRGWRDSFLCCPRSESSDCSASRSASPQNRWLHQFVNSRARRCSARRDIRRRPTKSFTFGRPCRKSGARAAGSPFLCWSSPGHEEPTRIGGGCNKNTRRCRNEDA